MNKIKTFLTSVGFLAVLTACGARSIPNASTSTAVQATGVPSTMTAPVTTTATGGMAGMDHGSASMNAPFDAMFIDGMIKHHQGAIEMAKEAQQKASKPEIQQLAVAIVQAQQAEIDEMNAWRKQWYPDLPQTSGMETDMGAMNVSDGAELYDVRFIAAMIPHHESAITMAQQAIQRAEHPELKKLAEAIITAQTAEITQMKQWYQTWTGKPYTGAM